MTWRASEGDERMSDPWTELTDADKLTIQRALIGRAEDAHHIVKDNRGRQPDAVVEILEAKAKANLEMVRRLVDPDWMPG